MSNVLSTLDLLGDPRLAAHAVGARPVWLWSADGMRLVWSNAVAARLQDANGLPPRGQIEQLATILPHNGGPRLARLRGLGGGIGRLLTCECSRLTLADNSDGILIASAEQIGAPLPLAERTRWLFASLHAPIAAFAGDGALLYVSESARLILDARVRNRAELDSSVIERTLEFKDADETVTAVVLKTAAARLQVSIPSPAASASIVTADRAPPYPDALPSPRRHPLRFVWQMDAAGNFTLVSDEFSELIGPGVASVLGRPWDELTRALTLDPEGRVAAAIASRDTWSDVTVFWPVDGNTERLPIEMSGLPAFDRDRNFLGYRGFGVCRDLDRIETLAARRHAAAQPEPECAAADQQAIAATPPQAPPFERKPLALVPSARNVLPFRSATNDKPASDPRSPMLSAGERKAFSELARELSARLKTPDGEPQTPPELDPGKHEPVVEKDHAQTQTPEAGFNGADADRAVADGSSHDTADHAIEAPPLEIVDVDDRFDDDRPVAPAWLVEGSDARALLERLPIGILIYRLDTLLYANPVALEWTGYASLDALSEAGGLDALFIEPAAQQIAGGSGSDQTIALTTREGEKLAVEGRLLSVPWEDGTAMTLTLVRAMPVPAGATSSSAATDREHVVLNAIAQGIMVFDRQGSIVLSNRHAEFLFGYDRSAFESTTFAELFAPESKRIILDYIEAVAHSASPEDLNNGREVVGCVRPRGLVPLHVTIQPVGGGSNEFFAICRDITQSKRAEAELAQALRLNEKTRVERAEFLARLGHEIRGPLTAIAGFSELMLAEKFGPILNPRYREYATDIGKAAEQVVALIDRLRDLSRAEAGQLDLSFSRVSLYEIVQESVAAMQPKASRARVLIRTSLSPDLPKVMSDLHSARQIVTNLLAHSIKFSGPGGQVIVSTTIKPDGDVTLRVRDTGLGMTEEELRMALRPFPPGGAEAGSPSLPLTKALAEANHASFAISSKVDEGTLIEITFPGCETSPG